MLYNMELAGVLAQFRPYPGRGNGEILRWPSLLWSAHWWGILLWYVARGTVEDSRNRQLILYRLQNARIAQDDFPKIDQIVKCAVKVKSRRLIYWWSLISAGQTEVWASRSVQGGPHRDVRLQQVQGLRFKVVYLNNVDCSNVFWRRKWRLRRRQCIDVDPWLICVEDHT